MLESDVWDRLISLVSCVVVSFFFIVRICRISNCSGVRLLYWLRCLEWILVVCWRWWMVWKIVSEQVLVVVLLFLIIINFLLRVLIGLENLYRIFFNCNGFLLGKLCIWKGYVIYFFNGELVRNMCGILGEFCFDNQVVDFVVVECIIYYLVFCGFDVWGFYVQGLIVFGY